MCADVWRLISLEEAVIIWPILSQFQTVECQMINSHAAFSFWLVLICVFVCLLGGWRDSRLEDAGINRDVWRRNFQKGLISCLLLEKSWWGDTFLPPPSSEPPTPQVCLVKCQNLRHTMTCTTAPTNRDFQPRELHAVCLYISAVGWAHKLQV